MLKMRSIVQNLTLLFRREFRIITSAIKAEKGRKKVRLNRKGKMLERSKE